MSDMLDKMTLRDYFAAKALQTILATGYSINPDTFRENAQLAYKQADKMMEVRDGN